MSLSIEYILVQAMRFTSKEKVEEHLAKSPASVVESVVTTCSDAIAAHHNGEEYPAPSPPPALPAVVYLDARKASGPRPASAGLKPFPPAGNKVKETSDNINSNGRSNKRRCTNNRGSLPSDSEDEEPVRSKPAKRYQCKSSSLACCLPPNTVSSSRAPRERLLLSRWQHTTSEVEARVCWMLMLRGEMVIAAIVFSLFVYLVPSREGLLKREQLSWYFLL